MSDYKTDLMRELDARGFLHQTTDAAGLDALLAREPQTIYIGFDCTAPSLHVGSLVQIMMLRHIQKHGHRPLVLMGGGTTLIGDPSGRDETRRILTPADVEKNKTSLMDVFECFLDFGRRGSDALMVDNIEWLKGLDYIDFLREYGPHFTINRMLTFDSVKLRLEREQPLTFLEFNYMIVQAYDFLELARRHDCRIQAGGSDQWGNIVNGIELARRTDGLELFGLTSPLITTADGAKMGKTARGAVWLNEGMLPAHDYYQYWRNTRDADVSRFLRLFTDLPLDEIAKLDSLEGQEINEAKKILAYEATRLTRGEEAAKKASATARSTFEQGIMGEGLPSVVVTADDMDGKLLVDLFVEAGLTQSKKETRRLLEQGGARLNDIPVEDAHRVISRDDFSNGQAKLSAGKKRHAVLKLKT